MIEWMELLRILTLIISFHLRSTRFFDFRNNAGQWNPWLFHDTFAASATTRALTSWNVEP